jgi:hypothetical protein
MQKFAFLGKPLWLGLTGLYAKRSCFLLIKVLSLLKFVMHTYAQRFFKSLRQSRKVESKLNFSEQTL